MYYTFSLQVSSDIDVLDRSNVGKVKMAVHLFHAKSLHQ